MSFHVQTQMIGACKGAIAVRALERPVARMFAIVARELVGARELPAAAGPLAHVRLLARMRAHVRFQMRRLIVHLLAAGMRARMVPGRALTGGTHARFGDLNGGRARHTRPRSTAAFARRRRHVHLTGRHRTARAAHVQLGQMWCHGCKTTSVIRYNNI